eukprot:2541907-Pyramimonas_sp.AAC.1
MAPRSHKKAQKGSKTVLRRLQERPEMGPRGELSGSDRGTVINTAQSHFKCILGRRLGQDGSSIAKEGRTQDRTRWP